MALDKIGCTDEYFYCLGLPQVSGYQGYSIILPGIFSIGIGSIGIITSPESKIWHGLDIGLEMLVGRPHWG